MTRSRGSSSDKTKVKYVDVFEPLPWQLAPLNSMAPVLLLTGSAGGGKSRVAGEKVNAFMMAYEGAMGLVVRKVGKSLPASSIALFRHTIIKRAIQRGDVKHNIAANRMTYILNGSTLLFSGISGPQERENIRSIGNEGGLDIIWIEEATQLDEDDFDELLPRLRGKAAPWRQIILTCNPEEPSHWINQRLILGGEAEVYHSAARDNPHNPDDYEQKLDMLRGVTRARLRDGKWVVAGNLVFDNWRDRYDSMSDPGGNVTREAEYVPEGGPVYWFVDDGYSGEYDRKTKMFKPGSHPRVFLFAQIRPNGKIAIFYESYKVKTLADPHIEEVLFECQERGWPAPDRVIYDKASPSLGAHLIKNLAPYGLGKRSIVYNYVPVSDGNSEVNDMLAEDENKFARIIVHPRCRFLRTEMVSYKRQGGGVVKDFDHGPDAIRMGVWDILYGGPPEVSVASSEIDINALELDRPEGMDYKVYNKGGISVAVMG